MKELSGAELETLRKQRVHRILTNGRTFTGIAPSMIDIIDELSSPDNKLDYRLVEVHAAAAILANCVDSTDHSPSIQAYHRLSVARRRLAELPQRSRSSQTFRGVIDQNKRWGGQYFDLAKGVGAWHEGFVQDYRIAPVDTVDGVVLKLDLGKYGELLERTNSPRPPLAARVAADTALAYLLTNEPVSNAFDTAGQLFRYIVDQPYPRAAVAPTE